MSIFGPHLSNSFSINFYLYQSYNDIRHWMETVYKWLLRCFYFHPPPPPLLPSNCYWQGTVIYFIHRVALNYHFKLIQDLNFLTMLLFFVRTSFTLAFVFFMFFFFNLNCVVHFKTALWDYSFLLYVYKSFHNFKFFVVVSFLLGNLMAYLYFLTVTKT